MEFRSGTTAEGARGEIERIVKEHPVVLFIKGSRDAPQCGFSDATIALFTQAHPRSICQMDKICYISRLPRNFRCSFLFLCPPHISPLSPRTPRPPSPLHSMPHVTSGGESGGPAQRRGAELAVVTEARRGGWQLQVDFDCVDTLDEGVNPGLRDAIKEYSQWPTIPQACSHTSALASAGMLVRAPTSV